MLNTSSLPSDHLFTNEGLSLSIRQCLIESTAILLRYHLVEVPIFTVTWPWHAPAARRLPETLVDGEEDQFDYA